MWFDKIKQYYHADVWNRQMVANAVKKGRITAEEYWKITGENY